MDLKIFLPFRVFMEVKNISDIIFETSEGSYGLLPHRLDCVAALVPGIFTYKNETGRAFYLAVDEGILLKAGSQVLVSVRDAVGGADLGKLGDKVKKDFSGKDENDKKVRTMTSVLESGFLYRFDQFLKE